MANVPKTLIERKDKTDNYVCLQAAIAARGAGKGRGGGEGGRGGLMVRPGNHTFT